VPEGRVLRDHASKLRWKLNRPVGGLVTVERAAGSVEVAEQVELTVVAPAQPQLDKLYETWERWLSKAKLDPAQPAAVTDSTVARTRCTRRFMCGLPWGMTRGL
jgi:hypothetical protein